MITNGQARRIAAEWQAPRNGYSALQHVGLITDDLADEIRTDMDSPHTDDHGRDELDALLVFVLANGPGNVPDWGEWDDSSIF